MEVEVVDLFCGVGGLSFGLQKQGFEVIAGIDCDKTCQVAYEKNHKAKFINADIKALDPKFIQNLYSPNKIKILVGCAPCQPFSRYTSGLKNKNEEEKWGLLNYFGKIIEATQPEIISMENVPQLAKIDKYAVYQNFINTLKKNGYFVSNTEKIINCVEYGIPQSRKRLVLLASKFGEIEVIPPTHTNNKQTVKTAIGHLPSVADGVTSPYNPLHRAQKLSATNKLRIKYIKQGQSWKHLPTELINDCHKKLTGKTFGDVYGRMLWDEPAPTMTTHCIGFGNGRFGHPEQDRAITLLEAAIFQTFPEDYFVDTANSTTALQKHIGNAVPVKLGEVIGQNIQ